MISLSGALERGQDAGERHDHRLRLAHMAHAPARRVGARGHRHDGRALRGVRLRVGDGRLQHRRRGRGVVHGAARQGRARRRRALRRAARARRLRFGAREPGAHHDLLAVRRPDDLPRGGRRRRLRGRERPVGPEQRRRLLVQRRLRPRHFRGRALLRGARVVRLLADRRRRRVRRRGVPAVRARRGPHEAHAALGQAQERPLARRHPRAHGLALRGLLVRSGGRRRGGRRAHAVPLEWAGVVARRGRLRERARGGHPVHWLVRAVTQPRAPRSLADHAEAP